MPKRHHPEPVPHYASYASHASARVDVVHGDPRCRRPGTRRCRQVKGHRELGRHRTASEVDDVNRLLQGPAAEQLMKNGARKVDVRILVPSDIEERLPFVVRRSRAALETAQRLERGRDVVQLRSRCLAGAQAGKFFPGHLANRLLKDGCNFVHDGLLGACDDSALVPDGNTGRQTADDRS